MRRRRFSVKRSRDLVWITTIVETSVAESTALDIAQLVLSGDWSLGNAGFDRCTLMGIRGWLGYSQTAAATATEATGIWAAMYVTDGSVTTNNMDPRTAAEYAQFDTIWTDGWAFSAATTPDAPRTIQLDIKSRRKLTTASEVRLATTIPTDTASPRCTVIGCVRSLLRLDPPG